MMIQTNIHSTAFVSTCKSIISLLCTWFQYIFSSRIPLFRVLSVCLQFINHSSETCTYRIFLYFLVVILILICSCQKWERSHLSILTPNRLLFGICKMWIRKLGSIYFNYNSKMLEFFIYKEFMTIRM